MELDSRSKGGGFPIYVWNLSPGWGCGDRADGGSRGSSTSQGILSDSVKSSGNKSQEPAGQEERRVPSSCWGERVGWNREWVSQPELWEERGEGTVVQANRPGWGLELLLL